MPRGRVDTTASHVRRMLVLAPLLVTTACTAGPSDTTTPDTIALDPSTAPTVELTAEPDSTSGFNLSISAERFVWTPEAVGGPHVGGNGHGVLYVDGIRTARVYTPWLHVDGLDAGTHELRVVLIGNDHRIFTVENRPVQGTATVEVSPLVEPRPVPGSHAIDADLTVSLRVPADRVEGWNVFVETTGLVWAPDKAGSTHVAGEGHAHLFVDGAEVGRLYGPAYHLPPLDPGIHEILVSLVGNDHAAYTIDGIPVEAATSITVEGPVTGPDITISYRLEDGVVEGPTRREVDPGALVRIRLTTDAAGVLRLNGYDISAPVVDGIAEITFTANLPGIFELELSDGATPIGSIVVG